MGIHTSTMESVELMDIREHLSNRFRDKRVLITGHTGFKGGWLTLWLHSLGAEIIGYSLDPPTEPSFFNETNLKDLITDIRGNILDYDVIFQTINTYRPEFIFHLAAQPLVRQSYKNPRDTFNVNIIGTINILDSIRITRYPVTCVCITSDKCYENREWAYAYRENDALGGFDPYSASKGAAEIVIASYRNSFFYPNIQNPVISLSSARAGNVIGGGDWAEDRIVPDCIKSLSAGNPVIIRNSGAVRPWQFILDPLFGYLWLALKMKENPALFSDAWNFGPYFTNNIRVKNLAEMIIREWGRDSYEIISQTENNSLHEAEYLKLDIAKSMTKLGWNPVYNIEETIQKTVAGYTAWYRKEEAMIDFFREQIETFMKDATNKMRITEA
jgi:CDP-glucose 4,6-dehydratase